MKFKIDEFDIEESSGIDPKECDYSNGVINEFDNNETREKLKQILKNNVKNYIRYEITSGGKYVGEVTFRGKDESKPEIGIEIEEAFRNQGIGFKILNALMLRLSETKNIHHFVYIVRQDNLPSIRLAEKLGGVKAKTIKPLEQFDFAILTYHITL